MADSKTKPRERVGNYFLKETALKFIKTGCTLLDLVLGGGWALGRISNPVGDNSSGKTLIAIEACANFMRQYPNGIPYYHESEAAFDKDYAESLGMPIDNIIFVRDELKKKKKDARLVEEWFNYFRDNVLTFCKKNPKIPVLYILDTQDALRSVKEQERSIDEGSYNQEKNQVLNRLYPEFADLIEDYNLHLMVISQTRQNIGATFGRQWRVTGEGALKFYASQRLQLAEMGKTTKTVRGDTRPVCIKVKANCFKNKVGMPYRTCEFSTYFGFGMDDAGASLAWLKDRNGLEGLGIGEGYTYKDIQELSKDILDSVSIRELGIENPAKHTRSELRQLLCEKWDLKERGRKKSPGGITEVAERLRNEGDPELEQKIRDRVTEMWKKLDADFMPKRKKY